LLAKLQPERVVTVSPNNGGRTSSNTIEGTLLNRIRRSSALALSGLVAVLLVGCASEPPPAPVVTAPAITVDQIVGKWGLAAYHRDTDRDRTVKEAKSQCNKPVVISKGPGGGVMMYLADNAQIQELVTKAGADGTTYLGPPGDAGTADDRILSQVSPDSFTTVWVDPDNVSRYGTMVYERCGKRS
jgi:hypothetical protein